MKPILVLILQPSTSPRAKVISAIQLRGSRHLLEVWLRLRVLKSCARPPRKDRNYVTKQT